MEFEVKKGCKKLENTSFFLLTSKKRRAMLFGDTFDSLTFLIQGDFGYIIKIGIRR